MNQKAGSTRERLAWVEISGTSRSPRGHSPCPGRPRCRDGFTLVELLVVIAIIGILAGMLLPVMAAAKRRAQTAQCISNLHQWDIALQVYASDSNDATPTDGTTMPSSSGYGQYCCEPTLNAEATTPPYSGSPLDPYAWFNVLPPLEANHPLSYYYALPVATKQKYPLPGNDTSAAKMWYCPAAQIADSDWTASFVGNGKYGIFCYVMDLDLKLKSDVINNIVGNGLLWPVTRKISDVHIHPSAQVFMFETTVSPKLEGGPRNSGTYPAARWDYFPKRHSNGGIISFLDGHVSYYKYKYVYNTSPSDSNKREELRNADIYWNPYRDPTISH